MIRPVLTELALFLAPFVVYAVYLWATRAGVLDAASWSLGRSGWLLIATRAGVLDRAQWPLARVLWLLMAALLLMIGSFVVLAHWGGAPPGATYVPAHVEDGKFVPGVTK